MLAIRKMGPIGNLLGMLPGVNSGQMKEALAQVDDRQLDRLQAIIRGMTPAERAPTRRSSTGLEGCANRQGLRRDGDRGQRHRQPVLRGRKMMKQMAGQFGMGGARRTSKTRKGKKGKGRSGAQRPRGGQAGTARPFPAAAGAG